MTDAETLDAILKRLEALEETTERLEQEIQSLTQKLTGSNRPLPRVVTQGDSS